MPDPKRKKILIICPSFPLVESGAEQRERAEGIRQLVRLGYEVAVVSKVTAWADLDAIDEVAKKLGITIWTVPYRFSNTALSDKEKFKKFLGRFKNPLYIDGAAYEFADPAMWEVVQKAVTEFAPDVAWFEYTYLWPLYGIFLRASIPIITRSQNFEPLHFLEESGRTFLTYCQYPFKWLSERMSIGQSTVVLAIAPREAVVYDRMTKGHVVTLPDRSVGRLLTLLRPAIRQGPPLHIFFMGASYNVPHNRAALTFILTKILPLLEERAPSTFVFHATGSKLPDELKSYFDGKKILFEGFVENLDVFCSSMDIALMPSLMGAGQQFKIIETVCRGIPTVTSPRGVAGWDLREGEHFLAATEPEEFVEALFSLREAPVRQTLSDAASRQAKVIFSQETLDIIVAKAIAIALAKKPI